jgi:hypothetical protein
MNIRQDYNLVSTEFPRTDIGPYPRIAIDAIVAPAVSKILNAVPFQFVSDLSFEASSSTAF